MKSDCNKFINEKKYSYKLYGYSNVAKEGKFDSYEKDCGYLFNVYVFLKYIRGFSDEKIYEYLKKYIVIGNDINRYMFREGSFMKIKFDDEIFDIADDYFEDESNINIILSNNNISYLELCNGYFNFYNKYFLDMLVDCWIEYLKEKSSKYFIISVYESEYGDDALEDEAIILFSGIYSHLNYEWLKRVIQDEISRWLSEFDAHACCINHYIYDDRLNLYAECGDINEIEGIHNCFDVNLFVDAYEDKKDFIENLLLDGYINDNYEEFLEEIGNDIVKRCKLSLNYAIVHTNVKDFCLDLSDDCLSYILEYYNQ